MSRLRIINLALPKTGTTTLTDALRHAGLSVADWKIRKNQNAAPELVDKHVGRILYYDYFQNGDPLLRLGEFDVINEMSMVNSEASLWPQTDWGLLCAIEKHHPGVRFVMTTRDPAKTADSMKRWNSLGKTRLPNANVPGLPSGYGKKTSHLEQWITGHYAFCRKMFAGRDNFMEYDIEDSDAQTRLSEYLGLELPWWGQSNVGKAAAQSEAV